MLINIVVDINFFNLLNLFIGHSVTIPTLEESRKKNHETKRDAV